MRVWQHLEVLKGKGDAGEKVSEMKMFVYRNHSATALHRRQTRAREVRVAGERSRKMAMRVSFGKLPSTVDDALSEDEWGNMRAKWEQGSENP